ncbi:MAG: pyruvate dehydrogenase (acetyl-transferring), homodimeric type, partial [Actinobacteria bacterium]|nr:pyruvate dehydrogenase (acetyl-transferring), homodimeric type [Actinomycetota bacterium]
DAGETSEWLDSLDAVVATNGPVRARFLLAKLLERAGQLGVGSPATVSTPYVNTIPAEDQAWFPGDEYLERRIRAYIRWNAAVMVVRANHAAASIGGHLSSYASSAALYEVGFNWFFRGATDGAPGDHVYFQGHSAPGFYARAFLEGRLSEDDLDRFRREVDGGLASYPHPRTMPDFWEFPTVSMGLGPIASIYRARFDRYLANRRIEDTSGSRTWCFVGDGEVDEVETLGALTLASRERLDNLTWVLNANLQRLDGPVRGNGKIIQELEGVFRGAGWNVIKVIWGSRWDDLLAKDIDGVLVDKMNATVDGEFQRMAVESGAYIREHFFGPDPRLRAMVADLSDEDLQHLPRGGHDYRKIYAAYKAAVETSGMPTVIIAKTIKGWTLGPDIEARNATHQIKKMTTVQLRALRDRLYLHDEIPDDALRDDVDPPYYRPPEGSAAFEYLHRRRTVLGGYLPARRVHVNRPLELPGPEPFAEFASGSGMQAVSTTLAATRLLRNLVRDPEIGRRIVPIIPDEGRTFGMDSLFAEIAIYAPFGQKYEPVDHDLLLSYHEARDGQILEEGITEAGACASFIAAGTSLSALGVPMVPFFSFYSMFGFQRVGDLLWAAADQRTRGFLFACTAGRTTLTGEGLQHADGHSHVLASVIPSLEAYDPAFAYETAEIVRHGLVDMHGDTPRDVMYYLTLTNENIAMPAMPDGVTGADITGGLYRFAAAPEGVPWRGTVVFSGPMNVPARAAATLLAERFSIGVDLWSAPSFKHLRADALAVERWNRLHPGEEPRVASVTRLLSSDFDALDVPLADAPVIAVTDYLTLVPDQVTRWVPRPYSVLGTDGFGRSDTREALRRFFEVDEHHIAVAMLAALARRGHIDPDVVAKAITEFGIDPDTTPPFTR